MGTGLGLSLCQEIVEEHGGTIRLGQAEPQGAVFRVTLPVEAPHGAALEETPPAGVPTIRGKRVLVVDDEPGDRGGGGGGVGAGWACGGDRGARGRGVGEGPRAAL